MLQLGALGTGGALAGCIGDDDDVPDDILADDPDATDIPDDPDDIDDGELPDDVRVDGQRLILPWDDIMNPQSLNPFWHAEYDPDTEESLIDEVDQPDLESSNQLYYATHGVGLWGEWHATTFHDLETQRFPALFDEVEFQHDKTYHRISEDAYWSDGEPITAWDDAGGWLFWRGWDYSDDGGFDTFNSLVGKAYIEFPDGPDGKTTEWQRWDDDDPFGDRWAEVGLDWDHDFYLYWAAGPIPRDGLRHATHAEPWDQVAENAWEDYQNAIENGEPKGQQGDYTEGVLTAEDFYAWREGEKWVSSGAWVLDELLGTEGAILKPNEHYRHADSINYDEVFLEFNPDPVRMQASLQAGTAASLDWAEVDAAPEAVDAMPDHYTEWHTPSDEGRSIMMDHSREFGDVRVRQAMKFALNESDIAGNVHRTAAAPVYTPGWDHWGMDLIFDESWAEDNLINYQQDLDRATQLMQDAGFSRGGDNLWERNGTPIQYPLATPSADVSFEETVVSQLNEFGFELNTQTFDEATFEDRVWGDEFREPEELDDVERDGERDDRWIEEEYGGRGDFGIWARTPQGDAFSAWFDTVSGGWGTLITRERRMRSMNFFDHEVQEDALMHYIPGTGHSGTVGYSAVAPMLAIEIPPIGEPDGELETFSPWHTSALTGAGDLTPADPQPDNPTYNPPHDERHEENETYYWQKFAWALNWWLPVIPTVRMQGQHFMNTQNWFWPNDAQVDRPVDEEMMQYLGVSHGGWRMASRASVIADTENPKDNAEVVPDE